MSELVDDCGDSIELGIVLYDGQIGRFVTLEVEDDELLEREIFEGDVIHSESVDEFKRECRADEFHPASEKPLNNPIDVLDEVMHAVIRGHRDPCAGYSVLDVRLAWLRVSVSEKELPQI